MIQCLKVNIISLLLDILQNLLLKVKDASLSLFLEDCFINSLDENYINYDSIFLINFPFNCVNNSTTLTIFTIQFLTIRFQNSNSCLKV